MNYFLLTFFTLSFIAFLPIFSPFSLLFIYFRIFFLIIFGKNLLNTFLFVRKQLNTLSITKVANGRLSKAFFSKVEPLPSWPRPFSPQQSHDAVHFHFGYFYRSNFPIFHYFSCQMALSSLQQKMHFPFSLTSFNSTRLLSLFRSTFVDQFF